MSGTAVKGRRKTTAQYPVEQRKEYVRLYLANQPITRNDFCAQYGIGRKSLTRWLHKYCDAVKESGMRTGDSPVSNDKVSDGGNRALVTIPCSDYYKLLRVKDKYDLICALIKKREQYPA